MFSFRLCVHDLRSQPIFLGSLIAWCAFLCVQHARSSGIEVM